MGVEPLVRALNRRDSALRRSLVSGEKAADETPSTGGRRRLSLSNAFSAISKSGMRTPRVRIKKSATHEGWLISLWSIGESNPVSLRSVSFAIVALFTPVQIAPLLSTLPPRFIRHWLGESNPWSAPSIGATPHRGDRLFRARKPPTKLPPLEVVGGFPSPMHSVQYRNQGCGHPVSA